MILRILSSNNALLKKKLVVKKSTVHGYGVFAQEAIAPGEMIEECVVIPIEIKTIDLIDYIFEGNSTAVLPLGFGPIYNHQLSPNASYSYQKETNRMIFRAIKPITEGEEIFISYGKNWFDSRAMPTLTPSLVYRLKIKLKGFSRFLRLLLLALVIVLIAKFAVHL